MRRNTDVTRPAVAQGLVMSPPAGLGPWFCRVAAVVLAFSLAGAIAPLGSARAAVADDAAATVVARYRARIPELMAEQGIPGLAVALVDADRPLWLEGFGHLDRRGAAPVSADTIFSLQS